MKTTLLIIHLFNRLKCGGKRSGKNNPRGCHNWQATIINRTVNGNNCPHCANQNPCPYNNLPIIHPEIIKEWDYERNKWYPN